MKKQILQFQILLLATAFFTATTLSAQTIAPPAIEWQQSFGGSGAEWGFHVHQTPDGGYMIAGVSDSGANGNKTSPGFGSRDFWVLRLDQNGNKLWERTFGGSGEDLLTDLEPARDGGWILAGRSDSPAGSGNKTSPLIGIEDFWMIRIDADGNKLWEKTFGRTNSYILYLCVQQTSDEGYILGGNLYTTPHWDGDSWAVRLDEAGNELWNVTLGGNAQDGCFKILQTSDGGFMVGGESSSPPSGNKTSTKFGATDFWLVRLDANGTALWDKSFGGSSDDYFFSMGATPDGGFLLGGSSCSGASGNKTSPYYGSSYGLGDFWLVRGNADGELLWDKSYGGTQDEKLGDLQQTADGGILLCGWSASGVDGNKTTPNFGGSDGWVVRLDAKGNKLWEQSFGSTNSDGIESIKQTRDGGYILAGFSYSGIGGNKTTPCFGSSDLWVIKLAPDALSAPPRLRLQPQSPAEIQTNGSRFFLSGVSNQLYRIEYSTDMLNWIPFQTNRASATDLELLDSAATNSLRRFYRAQPMPE